MAKRLVSRSFPVLIASVAMLLLAGALSAQTSESSNGPEKSFAAAEGNASTPPDSPTYDLRYKLSSGDVLRYDVTHRASIRSTIDQTTQAAQTKTDSVKLWKITDVLPNGDIEALMGGFGSAVLEAAADAGIDASRVRRLGIPDQFIEHGERNELLADLGLDAAGIAAACRSLAKSQAEGASLTVD